MGVLFWPTMLPQLHAPPGLVLMDTRSVWADEMLRLPSAVRHRHALSQPGLHLEQ